MQHETWAKNLACKWEPITKLSCEKKFLSVSPMNDGVSETERNPDPVSLGKKSCRDEKMSRNSTFYLKFQLSDPIIEVALFCRPECISALSGHSISQNFAFRSPFISYVLGLAHSEIKSSGDQFCRTCLRAKILIVIL